MESSMIKAQSVAFAKITATDFYSINRPNLSGGGGQSYIDINASDISEKQWNQFFQGAAQKGSALGGTLWRFKAHNLLVGTTQDAVIGRRRQSTFAIRNQKLPELSRKGERLHAWLPAKTGFPALPPHCQSAGDVPNSLIDGLSIFLVRDDTDRFWAGWMQGKSPANVTDPRLQRLGSGNAGIIDLGGDFALDISNVNWPFTALRTAPKGQQPVDVQDWDDTDELAQEETGITYKMQQVRVRNRAAVPKVKALYQNCQISGDKYVFSKKDGSPYLEVHHLIPLGAGGADLPHNMIVASAHMHKMLHYANVQGLDLANIKNNELDITINGEKFTIRWHPKHAEQVLSAAS